jgi:hypothetical protein
MAPNPGKRKNDPKFSAQLYEMAPGVQEWERHGMQAMDITLYLPKKLKVAIVKPRIVAFTARDGNTMALRFSGVKVKSDGEQLLRLCRRLAAARGAVLSSVLQLAELE